MKQVSLSGSPRENVGKKDAKRIRREGKVPCVLYGGKEQIHFLTDEKLFSKLIFTPEVYIIKLNIAGTEHLTIMQDVQYHPVTDRILHVDFLEIHPEKPVTIAVPVKLTGTPNGVLQGGKLHKKERKLKIKALINQLPDFIEIDIAHLEIGQSVKISDLVRDQIEFLDPANTVVVGVRTARIVVEETPEEAAPAEEGAEEAEKPEKKEE
ncbi:MAG: 50S ribosomal protein L25/general stress protein Ctc [bacterium]